MKPILIISILISALSSLSHATEDAPSTTNKAQTEVKVEQARLRVEPNTDYTRLQALIKNPPFGSQLLQLPTGKDDETLTGFYRTEGNGTSQGGIIIFPDHATHMAWPDSTQPLSSGLSNAGWYTLSIHLPEPTPPSIPTRTLPTLSAIKPNTPMDNSTVSPSGTNNKTPTNTNETTNTKQDIRSDTISEAPTEQYEDKIFRLGQTALTHMQENDSIDRFVIMGIGTGATWAARYVEKFQEEQSLRLIMIDAKESTDQTSPKLLTMLPKIKSTIIDLHHSERKTSNSSLNTAFPAQRLRLARHKKMINFHQSRLPATSDNWKRNHSWLLKYTKGMISTYIIKAEQSERAAKLEQDGPKKEKAPG